MMDNTVLFKFGSWKLNPLLVIKIKKVYGQRGGWDNEDRKIYRDKHRIPYRKDWYDQSPYHHPMYKKIYNKQPWYIRWYVLETPRIGRWNRGYVCVTGTDDHTHSLTCDSNQEVDLCYEKAMKNWTDALAKFSNLNK